MKYPSLLIIAFLIAGHLKAAEYFVGRQGNDGNDGSSKAKAFLTIQKGVDALKTGDTLTIAPGEYSESVKRDNLGGAENDTTIRAEIPGTVLLRGDVAAPEFKKVEGYRFVYAAAFDRDVQAVNEVDTLTILEIAPSVVELEFTPGVCFYDAGQKKLYISTSDMRPPEKHHYTVSVIKNYGLFLHRPGRVIVEGVAATGFNSVEIQAGNPGDYSVSGIMLAGGKQCVIRQCTAFLNANGIMENSGYFTRYLLNSNQVPVYGLLIPDSTNGPGNNLVEQCRAYGNYSRFSGSGGNIVVFNSTNDVIRDCISHGSATHGIRHYGNIRGPAIMSNNLSWGNLINDIHVKGGTKNGVSHGFGVAERCVTLGHFHVLNVTHCIIGMKNVYNTSPGADNLLLNNHYSPLVPQTRGKDFADPDNLDFRLQATAQFRGKSPDGSDRGAFQYATNIYYVKTDGADQADGLSMGKAWKTFARALQDIRPGDTLYLEGGEYRADLDLKQGHAGGKAISICGRGTVPVVIKGALRINSSHGIAFERLNFSDGVAIRDSENVAFNNCRFTGREVNLKAQGVDGLRVTHGLFTGFERAALELKSGTNVFLSGNIFDNPKGPAIRLEGMEAMRYCDYNSYRNPAAAWEVGGKAWPMAELQKQHERYARVLAPEVKMADGIPALENQDKFSAGGPNGMPLGVYREFREKPMRMSAPVAHSMTPTSANVEWWNSQPVRCELGWGETADCTNSVQFNSDGFCSFSLTGLQPGKKYFFRIIKTTPLLEPLNYLSSPVAPHPLASAAQTNRNLIQADLPLCFETAAKIADPATYYVAPDGDDGNRGLSREKAFRTVNHAADRANAGDTVMIAAGTYRETVRVRATGLPGRPIMFKSIPGEKVIFDSNNRTLSRAFIVSGKHHVQFDGLYFRDFDSGLKSAGGIFCIYKSNSIRITRCFNDGIAGYSPSFVSAAGCEDFVIRNCVAIGAMNGNLTLAGCPNAIVENNVLLRSRIQQCVLLNGEDQKIFFRNNIITDNQPTKVKACMFEIPRMAALVESNNCYFLRIPKEERRMFLFYRNEKAPMPYTFTNLSQITLVDYQQRLGTTNSIAADPKFKAALDMKAVDKDGKPVFFADQVLGKKDLDFPDLFATDPEVVKRGIGLQPEVFKDFNFSPVNPGAKPGP